MNKAAFTIKIDGFTSETIVTPDMVSAGDLSQLIDKVEKSIVETIDTTSENLTNGPLISLVEIQSNCSLLVWSIDPSAIDATVIITSAIRNKKFDHLKSSVQRYLHEIWNLTKRLNWAVQFASKNAAPSLDALITPETEIPSAAVLHGATTIYGECIRVGGENPATVQVRMLNGKFITAKITTQLAKELAKYLYREVALEGEATWDSTSLELLRFKVKKLLKYKQTNLEESLHKLYEAGGSIWDGIDDVAYIQELRAE